MNTPLEVKLSANKLLKKRFFFVFFLSLFCGKISKQYLDLAGDSIHAVFMP